MTVNFKELLNQKTGDVKPPTPLPTGTYEAVVLGHETGTSSVKGTPFVSFNVKLTAPCEDVDAADFEEFGGMEQISDKVFPVPFYLTERSKFRLAAFFTDIGLPDGKTLEQNIKAVEGMEVSAKVAHEMVESSIFAKVRSLGKPLS